MEFIGMACAAIIMGCLGAVAIMGTLWIVLQLSIEARKQVHELKARKRNGR